ncbi:hypothetical protein HI914_04797 [Erysiphe necator]|nr:hypothetical protein HI914_04797 [Erysiphe necator]
MGEFTLVFFRPFLLIANQSGIVQLTRRCLQCIELTPPHSENESVVVTDCYGALFVAIPPYDNVGSLACADKDGGDAAVLYFGL